MTRRPQSLKRVQIDMTEKAVARLEWLLEETDSMSIAEVIRDAVELREAIVLLRKAGKKIIAEDEKTGEKSVLVF